MGRKKFSEECAEEILNEVSDCMTKNFINKSNKEDAKEKTLVNDIDKIIKKLKKLYEKNGKNFTEEERNKYIKGSYTMFNQNKIYNIWSNFRNIHTEDNVIQAFKYINQLLPLLRQFLLGIEKEDSETLLLVARFENRNPFTLLIDEKNIANLKVSENIIKDKEGKEKTVKNIYYDLTELKKQSEADIRYKKKKGNEGNSGFFEHYNNFKKIAEKRKIIDTSTNKKGKIINTYSYNEGHITEAYFRHLNWVTSHKGWREDYSQVKDKECKQGNYNFHQLVYISLYYSTGNDPWWTGGDIGIFQIKGDNNRLASTFSVSVVANEIFLLWDGYKKAIQNSNIKDEKEIKKEFERIFYRKQTELNFQKAIKNITVNKFREFINTHELSENAENNGNKALKELLINIEAKI